MEPASMLSKIDSSIYTYKWQLLQDQFHNRCFINQRVCNIHISFLSYHTMFMISWLLLSTSSAQQMYKYICIFIIDIYVYLQEMHIYTCIILYIDEHFCKKIGFNYITSVYMTHWYLILYFIYQASITQKSLDARHNPMDFRFLSANFFNTFIGIIIILLKKCFWLCAKRKIKGKDKGNCTHKRYKLMMPLDG